MMEENFRDAIGTITAEGKRNWIYPKKPKGRFTNYRRLLSVFLIAFLVSAPFIKVNGNQFLLFNVLERRFHIFGVVFWPQDFHLLVISMIIGIIFVALFTVAYGRLFCGWVCPQTIFLEMVFRPIEYFIEGDRNAQIRLNNGPWNGVKIFKKFTKWTIYFVLSFAIANVFLAYLISSERLLKYISEGPINHLSVLIPLLLFTGAFYFVFTWFREQVCIIACPYGRLQGVLLDNKSVVVAYDYKRGEAENGRKNWRKNEDRKALGHGDCIDCKQCVHVCPTGIDIRNGTQLECVNCTACIDECDTIMEKVGLPKGLIRYASEEQIQNKSPFKITGRMIGYSTVLVVLLGVLITMLNLRNSIEATVLRLPGQLYQRQEDGSISNIFTYKLINKTNTTLDSLNFKVLSTEARIQMVGQELFSIEAGALGEGSLFITIDDATLQSDKTKLKVGVYSGSELVETTTTQFLTPKSFY
jgi:cytochrome c oxidase accessory protein FixG